MNSSGKREVKKPGEKAHHRSALDDLARARGGERRIAQYKYNQETEMKEEENEQLDSEFSEDDLKDFIVGGDEKFDRQYHEVSDEDDENYDENYGVRGRNNQKKAKISQGNTLLQYTNKAPTRKPDNVVQPNKAIKNKIDADESKKLMESLFDEVETTADYNKSSFEIKQLKGESLFAKYEDRIKMQYDVPLSAFRKSNIGAASSQTSQDGKKTLPSQEIDDTNAKKRKREEFTSEIRKTEVLLSKVEISSVNKDTNSKFDGRSYQSEIRESNKVPLGDPEIQEPIKTESMIIEEMLMQDMQQNQAMVEEKKNDSPSKVELANSACEKEWKALQDNTVKLSQDVDTKNITSQKMLNVLESDGSLIMYLIDVFEYPRHRDKLFLFGKVQIPGSSNYASCCIVVNNMERVAYFVPKELERGNANRPFSDKEYWINNCEKIQNELWQNWDKIFPGQKRQLKCKPVIRKYAFELPIPHGPNWYLKLLYPSTLNPPKPDLKGETFSYVLGTSWTPLENFLIKRKIRGPGWIRVKGPKVVPLADKMSWCQYEMQVDSKKDVFRDEEITKHPPMLKVLSIAVKTIKTQSSKAWEIGMISGMLHQAVDIDSNTSKKDMFRFTVLRRIDSNFSLDQLKRETQKIKGGSIQVESSEQALINNFINRVYDMDPDVIVAHDAFSSVLDALITRIKALKVGNWSRLGRLKKGEDSPYNGSAMQRARMVTSGRLICDTYLSSRELVRETDYNLSHLALRQLKVEREEVDSMYMETYFKDLVYLIKLIEHNEKDAFLTMQLMLKLQIIPLTKQLTCIGGNLWSRSLQNSRAERNEMLLMHELHQRKYIYPDKFFDGGKQDDKNLYMDDEALNNKQKKKDKKKYAGGLVLEPKVGLHEQITLLLDFNSLYPSIIQEYQICFTTLSRDSIDPRAMKKVGKISDSSPGAQPEQETHNDLNLDFLLSEADKMKADPECKKRSVLPKVIQALVEKRKAVKGALAKETDEEKRESLDIKQKAFKLVANSMYGCLGFSSSRFYAKPIAATITCCGRRILEAAVSIVREKLNYDIIYGDTDSIMVNSRTQVITDAIRIGKEIKGIINQSYQCLEIDIDGIFMPLLLLKKKKYAAKKLDNLGDFFKVSHQKPVPRFAIEIKGVDMVRRDWCGLSKNASRFILEKILGANSIEEGRAQYTTDEAISAIYEYMRKLGNEIREDRIQLFEFVINKQLTKHPNDYPDAKALPHVQVAKRLKERGEKDSNLIMHMIPYVICRPNADVHKDDGIAMRSYHPKEFEELAKKGEIEIDKEWYMHQQVMPPLTRICCAVSGISLSYMAECFGIDSSRYKSMGARNHENEDDKYMASFSENREEIKHDKNVELKLICTKCGSDWILKGIMHQDTSILSLTCRKVNIFRKRTINENALSHTQCANSSVKIDHKTVLNKLQLVLRNQFKAYYQNRRTCYRCASQTYAVYLTDKRCRTCEEEFPIDFPENHILNNIKYLRSVFDTSRYKDHLNKIADFDKDFFNDVKVFIEDTVLKKCEYDKVNLKSLFAFMGISKSRS